MDSTSGDAVQSPLLISPMRRKDWGPERGGNLPRVTQQEARPGRKLRSFLFPTPALS